jgi:AraC family transcriptional regulator, regulatory protein of adaptative response / DNA-3-methyladenine glycosylase II
VPGVGPWTADYVALRALADPDAWLPTDLGVRHALARLGAGPEAAERWRPYRAHAVAHLWASLAG